MSQAYLARQGYKAVQKEMASDKDIELRVFTAVTSSLRAVDMTKPDAYIKLSQAILDNLQLWKIVFLDLVNPENPLPLDLKTSLISLAEFTQAHSRKVLLGEADIDALIDVNDNIIAGLRSSLKSAGPKTLSSEAA